MIPKNREEGRYKGFDPKTLPTDAYERVYLSHAPKTDSVEHTTFDMRAPHNSHMSTVAYLERTFEFVLEQENDANHFIPIAIDGGAIEHLQIGSPGFAMQNNIKNMTMDFGYTTVVEHPHEWVPFYTHLYPKSLKNYIKYSGRSFHSDRADSIESANRAEKTMLDEEILRRIEPELFRSALPAEHRRVMDYYNPIPLEVPQHFSFNRRTNNTIPLVNFGDVINKYLNSVFDTEPDAPAGGYVSFWRAEGTKEDKMLLIEADDLGSRLIKQLLDSLTHHSMTSLITLNATYNAALTTRATIEGIAEAMRTNDEKNQLETADAVVHDLRPTILQLHALADFTAELF